MSRDRGTPDDYTGPLKRLVLALLVLALAGIVVLWRIDSPRVERFRAQIIDRVMPGFSWALGPVTASTNLIRDFQSYAQLYEQNQQLRRELQKMTRWKEAALQLEQENARLLDLNNVRLDPALTYVTGLVLADSGSPFRQSVLLNIGGRDGIQDGWAAMDGLGLVGRISGVGESTSRVVMLTDTSSRIPALIQPSGQNALVVGDNTALPPVDFIENPSLVRPGDRVVTSGDGGVLPPGLVIGQVAQDAGGRMRVRLSADIERLEFLRVLRASKTPTPGTAGQLVVPEGLELGEAAPEGPGDG